MTSSLAEQHRRISQEAYDNAIGNPNVDTRTKLNALDAVRVTHALKHATDFEEEEMFQLEADAANLLVPNPKALKEFGEKHDLLPKHFHTPGKRRT